MNKYLCSLLCRLQCILFSCCSISAVAAVSVNGVTGTGFKMEWSSAVNVAGYEVSVKARSESMGKSYLFEYPDVASRLNGYGILSDNVYSFTFVEYLRYGLLLGDDMENGYIVLPPVEKAGMYKLTVRGDAYYSDRYSMLYVYGNDIAEDPLYTDQFYNTDEYYDDKVVMTIVALSEGESVLLSAGRENTDRDEYSSRGRVVLFQVDLESVDADAAEENYAFVLRTDAMTNSCVVSGLSLYTDYCCTVVPLLEDDGGLIYGEGYESVEVRTLPCLTTYPLPDAEVAYEDILTTCRMRVSFDSPISYCNPDLISVDPQNYLSDSNLSTSVCLLDSDDDCSVVFQVKSWNTCLLPNTRYTVSFADGAVVFDGGTMSPAFSYSFNTGDCPSAGHPVDKEECALFYDGKRVLSKEGASVSVYDWTGRLVASGFVVSVNALSTGVYVVCSGTDRMVIVR